MMFTDCKIENEIIWQWKEVTVAKLYVPWLMSFRSPGIEEEIWCPILTIAGAAAWAFKNVSFIAVKIILESMWKHLLCTPPYICTQNEQYRVHTNKLFIIYRIHSFIIHSPNVQFGSHTWWNTTCPMLKWVSSRVANIFIIWSWHPRSSITYWWEFTSPATIVTPYAFFIFSSL